jgi:hypothetical protein
MYYWVLIRTMSCMHRIIYKTENEETEAKKHIIKNAHVIKEVMVLRGT